MTTTAPRPMPDLSEEVPYSPRNFWAWVAYQFLYRIGWQFKMESTMMAGLISYLVPSPTVMGLFTAINTVGRNVAPIAAAPVVDRFRRKVGAVLLFWGVAIGSWLALTVYLWTPAATNRAVAVWVFGACYTTFFVFLGATGVAQGALLGRIIPAGMRGRALAVGMTLSGLINVGAILFIYHVVRGGRFTEPRNYALAFTLTVAFFTLAGVSLLWVRETPAPARKRDFGLLSNLRYYADLARGNPNLARLMAVNVAVGTGGCMLQFYTAYWRQAGTLTESALVLATVFQVGWQSLSSSIFGRVADSRGNRHVICWLLWVEAAVPLAAMVLGGCQPFRSSWYWFLGVYTLVGIRFPLYQLLVNYLLEIVPQRDHAMALGATTTVQLVTAPAPILLGAVAAALGYPTAFVIGSAFVLAGAVIALGMEEVRVRRKGPRIRRISE